MCIRSIGLGVVGLVLAPLAFAQSQCPADTAVGTLEAPGFSCALGDKTFSGFTITGAPADARVQFGTPTNAPLFAVTLSRDGTFFPDGMLTFAYTVTPTAPQTILQGTLGVDVSFPTVLTVATMNGMALTPSALLNGGFASIDFSPGVPSVAVSDVAHIIGPAELNSITNDFAQVEIGVPEGGGWLMDAMLGAGIGMIFAQASYRRRK